MMRSAIALVATVLLAHAVIETAAAQSLPADDFTKGYQAIAAQWLDRLRPLARRTFTLLAGVELAVSGIAWGLRGGSFDETLGKFTLKVAVLSFMFVVILYFHEWIPAIINSFVDAGAHAAGVTALDPTAVAEEGIALSGLLMKAAFDKGLFAVLTAEGMAAVWAGAVIVLAFAAIAAQLVITLIEAYIAVTAGVFFVGFAAFRGTAPFADRYLVYAVAVGVRLFLLYLLVGAGAGIVSTWSAEITSMAVFDYVTSFRIVGGAIIFALITWIIPNRVAHHLTDGASFNIAEAVRVS